MRRHPESNPRVITMAASDITFLNDSIGQESEGEDSVLNWFSAKHPGMCTGCGAQFKEGVDIAYLDGAIVARDCCAGTGVRLEQVMPRGKSTKDACPECFLIHSTLQTECE